MKHAFSLLELIFVVVLIGIISGIGFFAYNPDTLFRDAQYTLLKLKEARYRSIGYEGLDDAACITLNPSALSEGNDTAPYEFQSLLTHTARTDTLCFDSLGRPHDMNRSIALESLTHIPIEITFENPLNPLEKKRIRIFPQSGYAIIIPNN